MLQISKTLVNDLGGPDEAAETVLGALESTKSLVPIIKPFIPKDPEPVDNEIMKKLIKSLAPSRYDELYPKMVNLIKSLDLSFVGEGRKSGGMGGEIKRKKRMGPKMRYPIYYLRLNASPDSMLGRA